MNIYDFLNLSEGIFCLSVVVLMIAVIVLGAMYIIPNIMSEIYLVKRWREKLKQLKNEDAFDVKDQK